MQLGVSAGDFLLASTVLYSLMPPEIIGPGHDQINFSTVLIAYVTAQIGAVISHVPGGYGILEGVLLGFLPHTVGAEVFAAVILFRIVYYFLPVIGAGLIFLYNEHRIGKRPPEMLNGM
jgi:phosphatidylglycerol lysyltransferase